jgi:hypothetical protein
MRRDSRTERRFREMQLLLQAVGLVAWGTTTLVLGVLVDAAKLWEWVLLAVLSVPIVVVTTGIALLLIVGAGRVRSLIAAIPEALGELIRGRAG